MMASKQVYRSLSSVTTCRKKVTIKFKKKTLKKELLKVLGFDNQVILGTFMFLSASISLYTLVDESATDLCNAHIGYITYY